MEVFANHGLRGRSCVPAGTLSLPCFLSRRLARASPALEGGKPPLTPPPLHTQYLPIAKRYNWIFGHFRDIPHLKWTLNHPNRIQNGHEYPVSCSILECASFWSMSNWPMLTFAGTFSDLRTYGLTDFRICLSK